MVARIMRRVRSRRYAMERGRVRRNILCLAVAMTLVSCSPHEVHSGPFAQATPPSLGTRAVPRTDSQLVVLNASRVTTGLEAARLSALLASAKYVAGTERTFVSTSSPFDRVSTRVLQFASTSGAAAYTRWVGAHPADLIGDAEPSGSLDLEGAPSVYVHSPNGCCPKDVPKSLAVWQRNRYVLEVIASGAYAKDTMLTELSTQMDRLV
jgi:hypothetical protein